MSKQTYSIFGAGAAGLYTAWRLLAGKQKNPKGRSKQPTAGDVIQLFDWGKYDFSKQHSGSRAAGGRVCTYHYEGDPTKSFVELGGMRYSHWDGNNDAESGGHRLVTETIKKLDLDKYSVPFNESSNPLYYLRTKNMYLNEISSFNPAPYNANNYGAGASPQNGFGVVEASAVQEEKNRKQWCEFNKDGSINIQQAESAVYQKGDLLKNIGYWNLLYDQLGSEGFQYIADGNGYSSNVINSNSAEAINANNEFAPGTEYKTLTEGYSFMFNALFDEIVKLAEANKVEFEYYPDTRLHSILSFGGEVRYTIAKRANPDKEAGSGTTNYAWLAMPRASLELVAEATRYQSTKALDVLNEKKVRLYLESAIIQPSYKIGMFFDEEWWIAGSKANPSYPAQLTSYEITPDVLAQLQGQFPESYIEAIRNSVAGDEEIKHPLLETPYASEAEFVGVVELTIKSRLTVEQQNLLLRLSERNTIGPSITDTPIRQVVYFGDNATDKTGKKIYGLLASYDDERFTRFWQEMELGPDQTREIPLSEDYQPLIGPRAATDIMIKMLRQQMARLHFGPQANYSSVPMPLETRFMDWSLPPFKAGYHAYAAHYDINDVQQKIRKPSQLAEGNHDAEIYIVGETYSNDQAWVEGAYCTAESVLNDFFDVEPIIDDTHYPFICGDC